MRRLIAKWLDDFKVPRFDCYIEFYKRRQGHFIYPKKRKSFSRAATACVTNVFSILCRRYKYSSCAAVTGFIYAFFVPLDYVERQTQAYRASKTLGMTGACHNQIAQAARGSAATICHKRPAEKQTLYLQPKIRHMRFWFQLDPCFVSRTKPMIHNTDY